MSNHKVYIASGWFNTEQANDLENILSVLQTLGITYYSPREECVCPPDADSQVQDKVFHDNIKGILDSDFIIANTRDKDMGTIFECGLAYSQHKAIIYYCEGLTGNFNLMLARSGSAVATTIDELELHVRKINEDNNYRSEYHATIE